MYGFISCLKDEYPDAAESVPHYVVHSKTVHEGRLSAVVNWFRKLLIEDIYRRICALSHVYCP